MSTVVFAATSQTGSAAIAALLEAGVPNIVAVARSKDKIAHLEAKGVKTVEADFKDGSSVAAALEGAKAAYVINPPIFDGTSPFEAAKKNLASYQQALEKHKVQRVVLLSSVGGEQTSGTGNISTTNYYERALPSVVPELVILRPPYFLSNWHQPLQGALQSPHVLRALQSTSQYPFDQIAPADIGRIAAKYLAAPASELSSSGPTIIEIKAPTPASVDDVAKAVEKVVGGPVQVATTPDDQLEGTLKAIGLPPVLVGTFAEMTRAFAAGKIDWTGEGKVERGTTTVDEYVREFLSQKK